jgi:hypothetical protein
MEHLYQFANHAFPDAPSANAQWCERQKTLLMASQAETVTDSIASGKAGEKAKKQLIACYQNNKKRMRTCTAPDSRLWHYRLGRNRIRTPYGHTEKNETLRTAMEYGWREKYASTKDYFHEQAMVESHRIPLKVLYNDCLTGATI